MHVDRGQQNVLRTVKSPFQPAHICRLAKVYMNIEMISVIRKQVNFLAGVYIYLKNFFFFLQTHEYLFKASSKYK